MKTFTLILILSLAFVAVNAEKRLCPSGYAFLGDDEVGNEPFLKGYWTEEISRSPTYSCYKIKYAKFGFNEAFRQCENDKGHLLTLDNTNEAKRLQKLFFHKFNETKTYLTSGFHFMDVDMWMWLGSNETVNNGTLDIEDESDYIKQCLSLKVTVDEQGENVGLLATRCLDETQYICEMRAQTVTYRAWFYSNWLTLLLALVVTVLLVTLIVSLFKFNLKTRVYRGRHNSAGVPRCHNVVTTFPLNDAPPSYTDVTGRRKETTIDKYRNKGREIFTKATVQKKSSS